MIKPNQEEKVVLVKIETNIDISKIHNPKERGDLVVIIDTPKDKANIINKEVNIYKSENRTHSLNTKNLSAPYTNLYN